jgi:hypothetical protein
MIFATSCLFTFLASASSFAQANTIRGSNNNFDLTSSAASLKKMTPREMMAKATKAKTGLNLGPYDSAALKNLHLAAKGENPIKPLATSTTFITAAYREDATCDATKPTIYTEGYLTETCFTASPSSGVAYSTFAYRCNTSKFRLPSLLSFSFHDLSSFSASSTPLFFSWILLHDL